MQGHGEGLELRPDGLTVVRRGEAAGRLFGGTITQLVGSLGTPYAFDPPEGCILFLEDVNERPYRVDRMLTQLRQSGILARAGALRVRRDARLRRGRGRGRSRRDSCRRRRFRWPGAHGVPVRPHDRAVLDAPAWRPGAHPDRSSGVCSHRGVTRCLMRRIHFIGICGTAMATAAALLKHRGHDVRGSDQNVYPPMSDFLAAEGIPIQTPFSADHIRADIDLVVVGNAISRGNHGARGGARAKGPVLLAARGDPRPLSSGTRGRSSLPARTARRRRRR